MCIRDRKSSHEVGITRLMKLVYLADVEHVQQYGEQMCDIKWIWYDFGPFSSRVYEAVEALDAEGVLDDVLVANRRTIDTSDLTGRNVESKLGARQRYILQRTLSRYGSLTLSAIRHVTHTTRTVMQAEPNGPLAVSYTHLRAHETVL